MRMSAASSSVSSGFRLRAAPLVRLLLWCVAVTVAPSVDAAAQIPLADAHATITTEVAPAVGTARPAATPVPHAGDPAATVTTSVTPAHAATEIVGSPVPHVGGGVITTTTGPAVQPALAPRGRAAPPVTSVTGPAFTVSANCAADATGTFTITDIGDSMTVPFTWRLSLNGTPIAQNGFQLNTGQSTSIHTSGLFGTLTLDVLDTSNAVVASGTTFCQSPPPPLPPAFTVGANCTSGSGAFVITDVGGNMTVPFTWRLSLDGTPIASNGFQLNAGQSINVNTSGLFGALTMDVLDTTNAVVATGSTTCQPPPPPAFSVSATCAADATGRFVITDIGGNMTVPFSWRLDLNGTPIATNSFQINAGQSLTINTSGLFGTLTLDVLDASGTVIASGSTVCQSPPPPPPPAFTVSANCAPDATGVIVITDVGGNMTVPFDWRLDLNGTPIASNAFQLNAGQSLTINTSGLFGTLTLDVLDPSQAVVATGTMFCPSPTVAVPDVVGLSQPAATSAIVAAGLVVGTVTTASSAAVPAGSVISQTPAAGTGVAAGSAVNLVVSSGVLTGDVNGDGHVDCADLAIVKAAFGKRIGQTGFDPRADVNHDGVVNIVDLATVARALPSGTVCS